MGTLLIILVVVLASTASTASTTAAATEETTSAAEDATTAAAAQDATTAAAAAISTEAVVCSCHLDALEKASTNLKCSEYKKVLGCLTSSSSCDTASLSSQAAKIVKSSNCNLTETCLCEKTYSTSLRDTKANQCSSAKNLKTCLTKITAATNQSCDGTRDADTLNTQIVEPEITAKCNGGASVYLMTHLSVLCLIVIRWCIQH